ncbi:hypothetical protein [Azospirillum rugosum]|uniref:Membrane protein (GlpM family) n=1 Tax=Azospirillum rugosum TaxID=416170 RepID=A0ABS4SEY5_9PROT|nr:hypothetical protein [Azospirillum rugosum]MBP2291131.1 putative membrane protein (GlpM family) [Azospirillum rugosum]MDQ0524805.1 putative membrane protein (GlpM family) [Azospirillum rugosum]
MPLDSVLLPLLIKVAAAALVVVIASIASEKAGPFFGGVISSLPVSTGPAYVLLAMEHDDGFIAGSALSSLVTNGAMILYLVSLVRIAPRCGMAATVLISSALWIAVAIALRSAADWALPGAILLNLACYALAYGLARAHREGAAPPSKAGPRWYDIPARAALVGVLVATVTSLSHVIGPTATGIAAIYPIALTSLTVILHQRMGGGTVAAAMRSALLTNPGLALALLTAHLMAGPFGRAVALTAALLVSLAWAGGLLVWRARRMRRAVQAG